MMRYLVLRRIEECWDDEKDAEWKGITWAQINELDDNDLLDLYDDLFFGSALQVMEKQNG
jgi:hypothetical protein